MSRLSRIGLINAGNGRFDLATLALTPYLYASQRYSSKDVKFLTRTEASSLKRGRGGRSSFSGVVATVFGASGFLGPTLVNRLGKAGTQVIIPYRGDHYYVRHLKVAGDLGQILFLPYHLCDEEAIRKAVKYSNVVINLVGRDWETRNFTFDQVHVEGARRIAKISKEMGVEKFIHMSALNSNVEHEGYINPGGSKFLKTKGLSEEVVREFYPDAIIFRPSDIYGQKDRFLSYYSKLFRYQGKWMPLPKGGYGIWKQPVYVGDVAQGIVNSIRDPLAVGTTYEAVGPRRYELKEMVDWFHRVMRKDEKWGYKSYDMKWDPIAKLKARINEYNPSFPIAIYVTDKIEREAVSDTTFELPTLEDLGVKLTKMEDRMDWELMPHRFNSELYGDDEDSGVLEKPEPPKYIEAS